MIYFLIEMIVGYFIFRLIKIRIRIKDIPLVVENESSKAPIKTYTIINSNGEKEIIMTTKSKSELLSELNTLANKYND